MIRKDITKKVVLYLLLVVPAAIMVLPFYWGFVSSFKPITEIFERVSILPDISKMTLHNYMALITETLFIRWYLNTFLIAVSHMSLALFFCSLAGYTFAKYDFPFKETLFWVVLSSMMIPRFTNIIPLFLLFTKIKMINTYWSCILPGSANAFGIFLMRQYIQGIPTEIMDSARIDGCTEFQIYYKVVAPTIKPAFGALGILMFLRAWNDLLNPLLFMKTEEMFTLSVGLPSLLGEFNPEWGWVMAGSFLSVIPVIAIFLRMQREFVGGLTLGSVKG